jgi:LPXTG-motif cell wall-anchored protein
VIGTDTVNGSAVRRVFALLLAVAVLMLPVALPMAHAEPDYPPSFYQISASTFNARVGESIDFKAQTFEAGSAVSFDVSVDGSSVTSGSTSANSEGIARKTITFTVEGTNTVTMSGTSDKGEPLSLRANVTITAAGGGGNGGNGGGNGGDPQADEGGVPFFGGGLPRTGTEIASTVLIGLVLLGGGAALVVATRRRRSS